MSKWPDDIRAEATVLIQLLRDALSLTKHDAERTGSYYGSQANCVKALKAADRWLKANKP